MKIYFCLGLLAMSMLVSCKKDETTPAPVITNFTPQSGIGATIVEIIGSGFSSVAKDNSITINDVKAEIISATSSLITVAAPTVFATGRIKVTVNGQVATSPADFVRNYEVRTLAGKTSGFSDGTGTAAKFSGPTGIAVDVSGNVFLADRDNHRIRKITADGIATTVGGTGSIGFVDGPIATAQFGFITSIAVDASGNLFVTEYTSGAVRKISASGTVSEFAGSESTFGDVNGVGSAARFAAPAGLTADRNGNIYVVDVGNAKVKKITPDGTVTTLAGSVPGGGDGTGAAAQFNFGSPNASIIADATGNLFVTDFNNHRIRKITTSGVVTTIAGSGEGGMVNGTGTAAQFFAPAGIAVDGKGNLYVTENTNSIVRKITPDGIVTTLAGTTSGLKEGDATIAQFNQPIGIAVDQSGNLFVADTNNNSVRKIIP